jgi:hypothetical protein
MWLGIFGFDLSSSAGEPATVDSRNCYADFRLRVVDG